MCCHMPSFVHFIAQIRPQKLMVERPHQINPSLFISFHCSNSATKAASPNKSSFVHFILKIFPTKAHGRAASPKKLTFLSKTLLPNSSFTQKLAFLSFPPPDIG